MIVRSTGLALLSLVAVAAQVGDDGEPPPPAAPAAPGEELAGGATTVFEDSIHAYSLPARNLTGVRRRHFAIGNAFFNDAWVTAPASTAGRDGLGPLFNARSCSSCHPGDGRGTPLEERLVLFEPLEALLVRLSLPGRDERGAPLPEPRYGRQLQTSAVLGVPPEATVRIRYESRRGEYADGRRYRLSVPSYRFEELAYGPLDPGVLTSPRVAPPVFGLGLLEAVPEEAVLARADPGDADGDGISGRPNRVWDLERGAAALGRFGWKANQPNLRQQVAAALSEDIGITTALFPDEVYTAAQERAARAPSGGRPEVDEHKLGRLVFYTRMLAPPARRGWTEPAVLRGRELFRSLGCAACHVPSATTGEVPDHPELSGQTIWPYTDLLLHDMGPGLADGRPDHQATGREWRTPPLWGIGLARKINKSARFLHDGRAFDLAEAILWHGGEGAAAAEGFRTLPAADREALVAFLNSL